VAAVPANTNRPFIRQSTSTAINGHQWFNQATLGSLELALSAEGS
jgi:hypothetical protein